MQHPVRTRAGGGARRPAVLVLALLLALGLVPAAAGAQEADPQADPRIGLAPGVDDAGTAASNVQHLARLDRPLANTMSDIAFTGDYAIAGNYSGFAIYDVSDPAAPEQVTVVSCPGSQNDVSVFGNLLFLSVEATSARVDCSTDTSQPVFRGVRIFDISDVRNPVHVGGVQTCRGSHTHTLVTDPDDAENLYIYVSGTAGVRSAAQLPGCQNNSTVNTEPFYDENSSLYRIEVIKVPLAAPQDAAVVGGPRIFKDAETGALNGLKNTPAGTQHPSGVNYSPLPNTNTCHDITAYPAIGLAAGACQGNGILLDISDPANPVRLDAVEDPNFSYWHSATFNNDGTKVVFTDEWGGGGAARCQAHDRPEWGANAIFDIVDGTLQFASYYKLPVPQSAYENCVAHNGSLIPVPGRDLMVQAWYQGGMSVYDFTDSANPFEIAYFDRGPVAQNHSSAGNPLVTSGGFWSTYWYNGAIYGTELRRGFDTFALTASEHLSANELAAAQLVQLDALNVQMQPVLDWPAAFPVSRSYLDQLVRGGGIAPGTAARAYAALDRAEGFNGGPQHRAAVAQLDATAKQLQDEARGAERGTRAGDPEGLRTLAGSVAELADSLR